MHRGLLTRGSFPLQAYGVLGLGAVFSSFIFFNIFAGFLSNLLGWAVPAYLSLRALESPGHDELVFSSAAVRCQRDRREMWRGLLVAWTGGACQRSLAGQHADPPSPFTATRSG